MSSTYSPSRQPPPQPSHSLDGMEQVVPPSAPVPFAHTVSRLHLDKPLPQIPGNTPTPYMTGSTAWSDDSSTADSLEDQADYGHRHSSVSTESYPVFVRSGSADLADFVDHPAVSTLDRAPSDGVGLVVDPYQRQKPDPGPDSSYSSGALRTFLAENRYAPSPSPPPQWTSNSVPTNRVGPNHYFRDKKFDFFPELATPSALPPNSPHNHFTARPRRKGGRSRWISIPINIHSDKGTTLADDVRSSLRNIQRRLSRNSLDKDKDKPRQRPITAPSPIEYTYTGASHTRTYPHSPQRATPPFDSHDHYDHSDRLDQGHIYRHAYGTSAPTSLLDPLYVSLGDKEPLAHVSDPISASAPPTPTGSSISDQSLIGNIDRDQDRYRYSKQSQLSIALPTKQKLKHLAVPITPYQRYGAAIWDKSGKEKKRLSYTGGKPRGVRFPRYRRKRNSTAQDAGGPQTPSDVTPSPLSPTFSESGRLEAQAQQQAQARKPLQQGTRHAVKSIQDGTSHVLFAIDGARRKIVRGGGGSSGTATGPGTRNGTAATCSGKDDLRRTQLKSQIRLIGPVNPYTSHKADPWI